MIIDTSTFLAKLREHDGIAIWKDKRSSISFAELVEAIEFNSNVFEQLGYVFSNRDRGQLVILVDVSLGWRFIPIVIAAMNLKITVIPLDRYHSPIQSKEIMLSFPSELVLDEMNVSEAGQIKAEQCSHLNRCVFEPLNDVAFLLYTSGTTGHSKGVMLTYHNIWSNVSDIIDYFNLSKRDRLLIMRPLTHASAITGELLPALFAGSSIVVKKNDQFPLTSLKELDESRTTVFCASPTVVRNLSHFADRYSLTSLRLVVLSGEILTQSYFQHIAKAFPQAQIWNVYGLTEASPRVSVWKGQRNQYRTGCVGKPLKNVSIQVVDHDRNPVGEGVKGELIVSGLNVMKGYYNDSEMTHQKVQDDWLYTGDIASIRNDFLYIHGRKDNMLIRGGNNVFPVEIEERLLSHPKVLDAYVFGKRKQDGTLKIYAWVTSSSDIKARDLHQFLIEENVEPRLRPDRIELKKDLPRTPSGKLKRNLSHREINHN